MTDVDRFWAKVDKSKDCWTWAASKRGAGYGAIGWQGSVRRAHRVAYELENGPIPEGMCVCHSCDTRECVRPSHLFLATQSENIQDMIRKGRKASQAGEHGSQAKVSWTDVEAIRSSTERQQDIARRFNLSQQQVSKIRTGRCWRAAMEKENTQ